MEYFFHIVVLAAIYSLIAISLDLIVGQMGLLSLSQAAFFGVGAYSAALCSHIAGLPIVVSVAAGIGVAGLFSLLIALPIMHLKKDLFAIATFGFQLIITSLMMNWMPVTGGPAGMGNIKPIFRGDGLQGVRTAFTAILAVLLVGGFQIIYRRLIRSQFGRVLRAIKEDEVFALASGKNVRAKKVQAFCFSASMTGLAGALYAHYITYISPSSFTVMDSILIISMVIIGGAGTIWGPVVGSILVIAFPEMLRFIGVSGNDAANLRQILYGMVLIGIVLFRPQGIMGGKELRRQ